MKPIAVSCLVLASILAAPLAAATPEPPALRLSDDAKPIAMQVELTILPELETFEGRVAIELEVTKATRIVWLNASKLEVQAATLERGAASRPATIVPGGEDFVGFEFPTEVAPGKATLRITYRGKLDAIETDGLFRQQDNGNWYAFSQFESTFARRAFPCFDEPAYRVPWRLTLHVHADHVAVSNTPVVAERPEAGGLKAVEFAETRPISSYLVALGVGPFSVVDAGVWGKAKTPIRIVMPRGHEAKAAYAAEVTGPILVALEDYFDIPYPFGKLDNLAIPQTVSFGAMENPGLITYADRILLLDPSQGGLNRQRGYAGTAAHENAHQWFGDLVTMAWWDDIWLNEGFATWMGAKAVAAWKPEWQTENDIADRRVTAMGADSLASSQPVRRPIQNRGDIVAAFDGISYQKGGALLSMFESWMGPEKFRKGVQRYLRTHAWGNATSHDFLDALAAEGGPEVARSFATFLDQPGVPVVSVATSCDGGKGKLALEQRRYVPLGSPVSASQAWQVPVRFRYGAGDRSAESQTMLAAPSGSAELAFCPEWIEANAGGLGYYITEYRGGLFEKLAARSETLSVPEQVALLKDANFLFGSGNLPAASALGLLERFAASPNRLVVEAAVEIAESIDPHFIADDRRANYARFVEHLFGKRSQALGLEAKAGESLDDTLLRPQLFALVADQGENGALRRAARERADAWIDDPTAIGPDMLGFVLRVAARDGDAAFFDRLTEAGTKLEDRRARQQVIRALGAFRDPEAVRKGLDLVLSGKFDIREASGVMFFLSGDREARQTVFDWVRASYDKLAQAMPEQFMVYMPYTAVGFCDAKHRSELAAFFTPRVGKLTAGPNMLARALDIVDICIARRAAQEESVSKFLSGY